MHIWISIFFNKKLGKKKASARMRVKGFNCSVWTKLKSDGASCMVLFHSLCCKNSIRWGVLFHFFFFKRYFTKMEICDVCAACIRAKTNVYIFDLQRTAPLHLLFFTRCPMPMSGDQTLHDFSRSITIVSYTHTQYNLNSHILMRISFYFLFF